MPGLGLGVGSRHRRQGTPSGLFFAGEQGVWYDPSDPSTLFQDAAGTTPVTAVEQPVGLMLDKSKGLVLGPELVVNGDFSAGTTGWNAPPVFSVNDGVASVTGSGPGTVLFSVEGRPVIAGGAYRATFTISGASNYSTLQFSLRRASAPGSNISNVFTPAITTVANTLSVIFTPTVSVNDAIFALRFAGTEAITIDNISVRELPGNHAFQTTSTSRPVLSARVNQLLKTEQFDDAAWLKFFASAEANAAIAPDGTLTADKLIEDTATNYHYFQSSTFRTEPGGVYTQSFCVKSAGRSTLYLQFTSDAGFGAGKAEFNLISKTVTSSGAVTGAITDIGDGWFRVAITQTAASASAANRAQIALQFVPYAGDGTSGIYIWGASLVPANQADLPYQRVNTATDYDADPAKFPKYLKFDGVDDCMVTPTITPGTDKMQVFAVVRKLSDATNGRVVTNEISTSGVEVGQTVLFAPASGATPNYGFRSGVTTMNTVSSSSGYQAPNTAVLSMHADASLDYVVGRVNGVLFSGTSEMGAGDFPARSLTIGSGQVPGALQPLNGNLYSLAVRFGPNLTDAKITQTEKWLAKKTGVAL